MSRFEGDGAFLPFVQIERASSEPVAQQIVRQIRQAVLGGTLRIGQKLPSSRFLATELGVARGTVVASFSQLLDEGYLESKTGSGTYVSLERTAVLHDGAAKQKPVPQWDDTRQIELSNRGKEAMRQEAVRELRPIPYGPFTPNRPAFDLFPFQTWNRLTSRVQRTHSTSLLNYGHPSGYLPLRRAAARFLSDVRGVTCEIDQIIVTTGSQRSLYLVTEQLLNPGDRVIVEEPAQVIAKQVIRSKGGELVPGAIDENGLITDDAFLYGSKAKLACVTPSCQYPLGYGMPVSRRLALLEWARKTNAWIMEDDDDAEFRFVGKPVPSMQSLDQDGRVFYAWSFSDVVFPALRLGILIVPHALIDAASVANGQIDRGPPTLTQAVLCEFINDGYLANHIRRMKKAYAVRREVILTSLQKELAGLCDIEPTESGLRVILRLRHGLDDCVVESAVNRAGIQCYALSRYYENPEGQSGLMLGFGCTPPEDIPGNVKQLARAISSVLPK